MSNLATTNIFLVVAQDPQNADDGNHACTQKSENCRILTCHSLEYESVYLCFSSHFDFVIYGSLTFKLRYEVEWKSTVTCKKQYAMA